MFQRKFSLSKPHINDNPKLVIRQMLFSQEKYVRNNGKLQLNEKIKRFWKRQSACVGTQIELNNWSSSFNTLLELVKQVGL